MRKSYCVVTIFAAVNLIFLFYYFQNGITNYADSEFYMTAEHPKDTEPYLINTSTCKIPNLGIYEGITKFVWREKYTKCSDLELLTYIDESTHLPTLKINSSLLTKYSSFEIKCCVSEIHRVDGNDNEIRLTPCKTFHESVELNHQFVKVICGNIFTTLYENVHAVTILENVRHKTSVNHHSPSILLVGIDTVSKQNLRRSMPKSYSYLEKHFINLKGYNKIEDNTFPNLMAILTGQNMSQLTKSCPFWINKKNLDDKTGNFLSECDIIWKHFSRLGYITAFGEDLTDLSTFNYGKIGFPQSPTDFYYRPYFLAAENLPYRKSSCHRQFCSGPEINGERMLKIAKDFSIKFKSKPSFGIFWMNSFSHDNANCPSAMDNSIVRFLNDLSSSESLKNTIFIFLSDHGVRYGEVRETNLGWLEERLPFIYLHIPEEFKRRFSGEFENILTNSDRLTTPYDLHKSLQHVLQLYNDEYTYNDSLGQSLFTEINEARTCEEAKIPRQWCTCMSYYHLSVTNPRVKKIAPVVVEQVNNKIKLFLEGVTCAVYSLEKVNSAGISEETFNSENKKVRYLLVMVKTKPHAVFETTVEVPVDSPDLFILGDISRVNFYGDDTYCVENTDLKKYCYCNSKTVVKGKLCLNFGICL